METSKIYGAHGITRDIVIFSNELQKVLHDVGKRIIGNIIQPKFTQGYARRVIKCVNREEEEAEGQKRRTRKGMIKVSVLSHNMAKKSDPRLA